jgi:hypothetical protein
MAMPGVQRQDFFLLRRVRDLIILKLGTPLHFFSWKVL